MSPARPQIVTARGLDLESQEITLETPVLDAWRDTDVAPRVWRRALTALTVLEGAAAWRPDVYSLRLSELADISPVPPSPEQLNIWLAPTGWRVEPVDGYVEVRTYQEFHQRRVFPICRRMRRMRDLEHSPTPDFFHDVVGHLPMLFDGRYRDLLLEWAELGAGVSPSPEDHAVARSLERLNAARERDDVDVAEVAEATAALDEAHRRSAANASRYSRFETFYTWAVEYGLVRLQGRLQLIGAAVLSSAGELRRLANGDVAFGGFAREGVGRLVNYTNYQSRMFVAEGYDEYLAALRAI
jgi:phenylalanine-4-hydroxylase